MHEILYTNILLGEVSELTIICSFFCKHVLRRDFNMEMAVALGLGRGVLCIEGLEERTRYLYNCTNIKHVSNVLILGSFERFSGRLGEAPKEILCKK